MISRVYLQANPGNPKKVVKENCAFKQCDCCTGTTMRTITKAHQASRESMILDPSVRIEPVRTESRDRGIGVDSSNVYREQRAGRYAFRSSVVVQKQVLFGAAIKHALALLPGVPAHFVAIQESHLQIRASKEMPSRNHDQLAGGGDARHPVGDTLRKNLAV